MIDRRTLITGAVAASATPALGRPAGTREMAVTLAHPGGRTCELRAVAPAKPGRWPVVLFSHGANSSNRLYERLFQPWAQCGFCVIAANHLDSGGPPPPGTVPPEGLWATRLADLALPLDQPRPFDEFARRTGGRIDWGRVCAAGHSFGGAVAQGLAGATMIDSVAGATAARPDRRVGAIAAFSPPGPREGLVPPDAWSTVKVPALLQTGDADVLPGFIDDWRIHKAGFDPLPGRRRWLLVGRGVDHYFGGLICRLKTDAASRAQEQALVETVAISTDFLRANLKADRAALARLRAAGYGPEVALTRL